MNFGERLEQIDSEIVPEFKLAKIQNLIARGRKTEASSLMPNLNPEPELEATGLSQDDKDINLLRSAGIRS